MNKIIDIFSYDGNKELLEFKLNFIENSVDLFWICDSTSDQSLESIIQTEFKNLSDRVTILPDIDLSKHSEILSNKFKDKKIKFDDIIIFSKIDEVYNELSWDTLSQYLPFGPRGMKLSHTNSELTPLVLSDVVGPIFMYRTTYVLNPREFKMMIEKVEGIRKLPDDEILPNIGYKIVELINKNNFLFILD